jgi:hypothetical protein
VDAPDPLSIPEHIRKIRALGRVIVCFEAKPMAACYSKKAPSSGFHKTPGPVESHPEPPARLRQAPGATEPRRYAHGGLLLNLFSGSGIGAVAASAWGMRSVSIEREDAYVQMIHEHVAAEVRGM